MLATLTVHGTGLRHYRVQDFIDGSGGRYPAIDYGTPSLATLGGFAQTSVNLVVAFISIVTGGSDCPSAGFLCCLHHFKQFLPHGRVYCLAMRNVRACPTTTVVTLRRVSALLRLATEGWGKLWLSVASKMPGFGDLRDCGIQPRFTWAMRVGYCANSSGADLPSPRFNRVCCWRSHDLWGARKHYIALRRFVTFWFFDYHFCCSFSGRGHPQRSRSLHFGVFVAGCSAFNNDCSLFRRIIWWF